MTGFVLTSGLVLALALPAFCDVACYYGWTQDGDANPAEDWDGVTCEDKATESCIGAECLGTNAICYKVKFGGDDEFLSLYGCVDDFNNPSEAGSWVPGSFSVADLNLITLGGTDDECETDEAPVVPTLPEGVNGLGSNVEAEYCTCIISECNGAGSAELPFVVLALSAFVANMLQ